MKRTASLSKNGISEKKMIIIGAGVAGLAAGIYARKNGFQATIYEMHHLPGGMCTAWKRGGYTFLDLDNFYMTGQWVKGFGVPMAAMSGKEVVQTICKAEGKKFRA